MNATVREKVWRIVACAFNMAMAPDRRRTLIASTRTAAYSLFAEDRLGTLEVGKQADLAVLSQDIFKVSNDELPKTESVLTIVGGKIGFPQTPDK